MVTDNEITLGAKVISTLRSTSHEMLRKLHQPIRPVLPTSKSRRATASNEEEDSSINEICTKLTIKYNIKNADNSVILSVIFEMKQALTESTKETNDKIEKLTKRFDDEIKFLKDKLKHKETENKNLKDQLESLRDHNTKLQTEMRLQSQEIKNTQDAQICFDQYHRDLNKINSRLDSIDGKCFELTKTGKLQFSEIVKNMELSNDKKNEKQINDSEAGNVRNEHTKETNDDSFNATKCEEVNQNHKNAESIKDYTSHHQLKNSNLIHLTGYDDYDYEHIDNQASKDSEIFTGVVRRRTRRIVLYNVKGDNPYDLVSSAVKTYAEKKGVKVTFTKLLRKRENRGYNTYTMRVNISETDFSIVENDETFWPKGVYWRDYVPYNKNNSEQSWG